VSDDFRLIEVARQLRDPIVLERWLRDMGLGDAVEQMARNVAARWRDAQKKRDAENGVDPNYYAHTLTNPEDS